MSWLIRDILAPGFDAPVIQDPKAVMGWYSVRNRSQRNAIAAQYRRLDSQSVTLCYVHDDRALYTLVNNPPSGSTQDSDWEFFMTFDYGLKPVGNWDPTTNTPAISDAAALSAGSYYFVTGAPSGYTVNDPNLFLGLNPEVFDGDTILSVETHYIHVRTSTTWDSIAKPQAITDYVNGIVIAHSHVISDVSGLQAALDSKFDSNDVADSLVDYSSVPDQAIVDKGFLDTWFINKDNAYTQADVQAYTYDRATIDAKDTAVYDSLIAYLDAGYDTSSEVNDKIAQALVNLPDNPVAFDTISVDTDSGYTWGANPLIAGTSQEVLLVPGTSIAIDTDDVKNGVRISVTGGPYIPASEKGAASGVAPLNASSLVDAAYLPSYVDDVLEYADFASLPGTGETGKIYVTLDDNKQYRWSGSAYINFSAGALPGGTAGQIQYQIDAGTFGGLDGDEVGGMPIPFGINWVPVTSFASMTYLSAIAHADGTGILLAGGIGTGHLFRSVDYGNTWTDAGLIAANTTGIYAIEYCGNGIFVLGTSYTGGWGQIIVSTDYGLTWTVKKSISGPTAVREIVYLTSGIVIAGVDTIGTIFRSTDYGQTWDAGNQLRTEGGAFIQALDYGNGVLLVSCTQLDAKLYKSVDNGVSFTQITGTNIDGLIDIWALGYIDLDNWVMHVDNNGAKVQYSTDAGATWALSTNNPNGGNISDFEYTNGILLAGMSESVPGDGGAVAMSYDKGLTWINGFNTGEESAYRIKYAERGILFLGTSSAGKLFKAVITSEVDIPGGTYGQIQYNNNGVLGGIDAKFLSYATTNAMGLRAVSQATSTTFDITINPPIAASLQLYTPDGKIRTLNTYSGLTGLADGYMAYADFINDTQFNIEKANTGLETFVNDNYIPLIYNNIGILYSPLASLDLLLKQSSTGMNRRFWVDVGSQFDIETYLTDGIKVSGFLTWKFYIDGKEFTCNSSSMNINSDDGVIWVQKISDTVLGAGNLSGAGTIDFFISYYGTQPGLYPLFYLKNGRVTSPIAELQHRIDDGSAFYWVQSGTSQPIVSSMMKRRVFRLHIESDVDAVAVTLSNTDTPCIFHLWLWKNNGTNDLVVTFTLAGYTFDPSNVITLSGPNGEQGHFWFYIYNGVVKQILGGGAFTTNEIVVTDLNKTDAVALDLDNNAVKVTLDPALTGDWKPADFTGWIEDREYTFIIQKDSDNNIDFNDLVRINFDDNIDPFENMIDMEVGQRSIIKALGLPNGALFGRLIVPPDKYKPPVFDEVFDIVFNI